MKYMSDNSLSALVTTLKNTFAAISHTHTMSDVSGTLPISKGGTGATDKFSAMANIAYNIVASGNSTNLNSYTAQTVSVFSAEVPATTNLPNGSNGVGMLVTITADRTDLSQIWIGMTSGKSDTFIRTKVNNIWSDWGKIYNTNDDLPAANHVKSGIATNDVSTSTIFKRAGVNYFVGYIITAPTSTTASTVTVGYIPELYRGTGTVYCVAYNATENTHHTCAIYSSGSIRVNDVVKTSNATQNFYISAQWI